MIRNATFRFPFGILGDYTNETQVTNCNECLCEAVGKPNVRLFTCTSNTSCQFYYFMPKIDEIYLSNDTDIYVMNETAIFEEKYDCCDTEFLVKNINKANKRNHSSKAYRFLIGIDNDTIISTLKNAMLKINARTFVETSVSLKLSGVTTVGYNDNRYYFNNGNTILVYDENLTSPIYDITLHGEIAAIRFISKNQMLVGSTKGGHILKKQDNETRFGNPKYIDEKRVKNVHAFGVINETSFYVGYENTNTNIHLYTINGSNSLVIDGKRTIQRAESTYDIFVDGCKRIWATGLKEYLSIYEPNKNTSYNIDIKKQGRAFGLLILENYELIITHDIENLPLTHIKPSLTCRP